MTCTGNTCLLSWVRVLLEIWTPQKRLMFLDILRTKWWKIQYKFSFSFTAFCLLSGLQPWRWSFHSQWICNCGISVFSSPYACLAFLLEFSFSLSNFHCQTFIAKLFPPRFGHSTVSDTFQGAFAWPLSFHFLDRCPNPLCFCWSWIFEKRSEILENKK